MAESPEEPHLSGLARSIDALFSATRKASVPPPPPAAPTLVTAPAPHGDPAARIRETLIEPRAPGDDPRPQAPHMFPQTQMLEAISVPTSAGTSPHAGIAEPPRAPAAADAPAPETMLSFEAPAAAVMDFAPPSSPAELDDVVQPPRPSDEATFGEAVEAYLGGDRDARRRVEELARGLKDRLALDPLADAVERLVQAAGEPPDHETIDLAAAVVNPAVASRLVQRMGRERDGAKRAEAMRLCRRLGVIMANALKGALTGATEPAVRRVYHEALISMGEVSRPVIEAMVQDENRFLVRDAVVMLGEIGGARAVELVTSALADTDPRVRVEALRALAKLGDADAGRLALGFLDDADASVRLAAAVAAGRLGLARALRPLLNLLEKEEDPHNRVLLLQALGELGDPGAVPTLEKHAAPSRFAKADTEVRVAAYRALHRIGTPRAREVAQRAANDKDPGVRAALRGLTREG